MSEETGRNKFVGRGLQRITRDSGVELELGESDDLWLSEFLEAVDVDFVKDAGAGGSLRKGDTSSEEKEKVKGGEETRDLRMEEHAGSLAKSRGAAARV